MKAIMENHAVGINFSYGNLMIPGMGLFSLLSADHLQRYSRIIQKGVAASVCATEDGLEKIAEEAN